MKSSLIEIVAGHLYQQPSIVLEWVSRAPTSYKRFMIPKKTKGMRVIYQPSAHTKTIQYSLMDCVLSRFPVHVCAAGYRSGIRSPLLKNAQLHADYGFTVRVDLRDFFPSLKPEDLFSLPFADHLALSQADKAFLTKSLFVRPKGNEIGLAIGAPSSPMVSNAMMYELDGKIDAVARDLDGVYSRYADDLVFSANDREACIRFVEALGHTFETTLVPRLTINEDKTVFMSRGNRRLVTGLVIGSSGSISVGRSKKRYIRKLMCDYANGNIVRRDLAYLQGYLAFVCDVDHRFFAQLAEKYQRETVMDALHSR